MFNTLRRIQRLVTGKYGWVDPADESIEWEHLSWRTRWALDGIHAHNWKWVLKYGKLECGCVRNPVTRKLVLYVWRCPSHMSKLREGEK